jgi:hypothetical protein
MKLELKKPLLFLLIICLIFKITPVFSQDFYINRRGEAVYLRFSIPSDWINLNLNESYEFLSKTGFTDINSISNSDKVIVRGIIKGQEYTYTRRLVFENKLIKEYSDYITFFQPCIVCLANDLIAIKSNDRMIQELNNSSYESAIKLDNELKNVFYKNHEQSLIKDGIQNKLYLDITDYGFKYTGSKTTDNFTITRNSILSKDGKIYEFFSERKVTKKDESYFVGDYNLNNVNQFDLRLMIDIFLLDCKNNGITVNKGKVNSLFETLEGDLLGISYGYNNDNLIELKVDPTKWEKSSIPKRWYLIYHELGHDVLNLNHGNGGKMMFNFADKGYSWKEFWDDRNYMFESYRKYKK